VILLNNQLPKPYVDAMVDYYPKGAPDESQPTDTAERVTGRRRERFGNGSHPTSPRWRPHRRR
jgi:hypothetical protein